MHSPSPRRLLLDAFAECLSVISTNDGYRTNVGTDWTLEPRPGDATSTGVFTALIEKQQRAADAALVQTHRLTTVAVIAKLPADTDHLQERLDDLVTDIEMAMSQKQRRFPPGFTYPVYLGMEPLMPESAAAGWVGVSVTYQSHIPK